MIFGINAYVFYGVIVAGVAVMGVGLLLSRRTKAADPYEGVADYLIAYGETKLKMRVFKELQ